MSKQMSIRGQAVLTAACSPLVASLVQANPPREGYLPRALAARAFEYGEAIIAEYESQYGVILPENHDPDLTCPSCGLPMELRKGNFGYFYGCTGYPECSIIQNSRPDGSPFGLAADKETRDLRREVHALFDPLWKDGEIQKRFPDRAAAYVWLAKSMDLATDDCHMSMMDADQCKQAIKLITRYMKDNPIKLGHG